MILLAVGTQFPFDRLVRTVDEWAVSNGRADIVAQTGRSAYTAKAITCFDFMDPPTFREYQRQATLFVAHAGMGSILTALEFGKPIIVMPRDHLRGEHRNGHQLATAKHMKYNEGIYVAYNETELKQLLSRIDSLKAPATVLGQASPALLGRISQFIEADAAFAGKRKLFGRS